MSWFTYSRAKRTEFASQQSYEDFESEILGKMKETGSAEEHRALEWVLGDITRVLTKKRSHQRNVDLLNLLRGIVNLWAVGKMEESNQRIRWHRKTLKRFVPKHDPRYDALFPMADEVFSLRNEQANQMKGFLIKYHTIKGRQRLIQQYERLPNGDALREAKKEAPLKVVDGKLQFRKNVSLDSEHLASFKFMVEQTKPMGYNEALKEANKKTAFRDWIIPVAEFDEHEEDIQNAYKQWRKRRVTK